MAGEVEEDCRRAVVSVKAGQLAWARERGIEVDTDGYCPRLEDNLFRPLSAGCRQSFAAGDGGELGTVGRRGKMQALHSSSALACNVFDFWTDRGTGGLARSLGVAEGGWAVQFERKFPTGLRGNPPNLDVVLEGRSGLVAIESKFLETYATGKGKFRESYFPAGRRMWAERGLAGAQRLAEAMFRGDVRFALLDAAQLLKHMLGLACSGREWALLCVWFRVEGEAGDRHARELTAFAEMLGEDVARFRAVTYQEVFRGLGAEGAYARYLLERYGRRG